MRFSQFSAHHLREKNQLSNMPNTRSGGGNGLVREVKLTSTLNIFTFNAFIFHNSTCTNKQKRCIIFENDKWGRFVLGINVWQVKIIRGSKTWPKWFLGQVRKLFEVDVQRKKLGDESGDEGDYIGIFLRRDNLGGRVQRSRMRRE